ncbi:MAG TPA: tripartite tricarboxylate transporter substrate-binding protein [Xanthobacteraceae bacterium]|jgi:tripartite-type tricarboxylate transporter receptor subunit TctC
MNLPRRAFLGLSAAAAVLRVASRAAWAQAYPARPVRVLVPFAPGGQVDVIARLVAQRLSEQLGQQFYVENAAGGGGTIGAGRAAQSAPDGHTILITDGIAFTASPGLYAKVPYDATRDFDPVTIPATTMQVLAVHPSVEAHSIAELVALIRANPGKFSYASAGVGTGAHLTGELFRNSLGLDLVHVPYNSGGQAIQAAVGGHTPISFGSPAATIPQVNDAKLRALAVGGKKRVRGLPEVPTMREAGFAEVECDAWIAVLVPAGAPRDVIARLHDEIARAVALPEVEAHLVALGFEPFTATPDEMAALTRSELPKWAGVIRAAGIRPN